MRSEITPGQTSDYLGFDLVMDDNLPEPCVLLADRGYDSDNVRKTMEARNVVPVIPMRKTRKPRVAADRTLYRLRNLVERCFNRLKNAVRHRPRTNGGSMPHRRNPLRQDRRKLPWVHRHHLDPPLAPTFVNMT